MEQDGAAKKLTGQILLNWLTAAADGHGGIQSVVPLSTSGLTDTYRITLADTTVFDFAVTNGKGISDISPKSTSGLNVTYEIKYSDGTTSTFVVKNGAKGDKGDTPQVWVRYASQEPTAASHDFGILPDDWMGFYSGFAETAPTDWQQYLWFKIKGEKGDTGAPAVLVQRSTTYMVSDSGTIVPSGSWQSEIPNVPQGKYLWTRTVLTFNTGSPVTSYSVSRMGLDGTGAVSKVCGKEPNSNGNVELEAENVGALPSAGGLMTGNIAMNSHQIKVLGAPTDSADAATKGYVDTALSNAKTIAKTATLTAAGWSASAPYTQSVTVSGLTDTKRAMAYPVYGSNTETNLTLKEACGMVSFASRSGNVLTFTCLEDKPTVNIPITVEVYV